MDKAVNKKESKKNKSRVFMYSCIVLSVITALLYGSFFLAVKKDVNENNVYGFTQYESEVTEKLEDKVSDIKTDYKIGVVLSDGSEATFIIGRGDHSNLNIGDKIYVISNGEDVRLGTLDQVGVISRVTNKQ